MKKIRIYINKEYAYTTTKYNTVKETIEALKIVKTVKVASIPDYVITLNSDDKITGQIVKEKY